MIDKIGTGVFQNTGLQNAKSRTDENPDKATGLSKIESRLADQVSLSASTRQNLEQLKNLDRQLSRFADVLKGKQSIGGVLNQLNREDGIKGVIAGFESRSTLSSSQITAIQDITSLSAEINDEGELDLIVTNVRETLQSSNLTLASEQRSYLASFA
jgi:hypothetical protein